MVIDSNKGAVVTVNRLDKPQQNAGEKKEASPEQPPTQLDKLLDSKAFGELVGKSLKKGDTLTISIDGKPTLEIKRESPDFYANFKAKAADAINTTSEVVSDVVNQDPAFAFRESAMAVKPQVLSAVPDAIKTVAENGFLPAVRVVAAALDIKRAVDTFKSKNASKIDKVVDMGHVVTDFIGVAGVIAMFAIPAAAGIAIGLTATGLMGDIGAYGYHVMKYFKEKGLQLPPGTIYNKPPAPQQPSGSTTVSKPAASNP